MRRVLVNLRPFNELEKVKTEFDNLLQNLFPVASATREVGFIPALDIYETDKDIVVKAELPGIQKEDIEVSVKDNVLYIKGEKKEEKEENTEHVHMVERSFGSFERTVKLPDNIKTQEVSANYKNGILEIRFPKKEDNQKKIVINLN